MTTAKYVQPASPGGDVGKVADPHLVWTLGTELSVDPIQWTRRLDITDGVAYYLVTYHTTLTQPPHQSLDRATGHANAFA